MQSIADIRELLRQYGLRPRKRFGQNFLHDQNQVRKLLDAASVQPGDIVLELGPGTGVLTEALLESGAEVIACEIDRDLAQLIDDRLGNRLTLVRGDAIGKGRSLSADIVGAIAGRPFKLVANLPYQIASPLMAELVLNHQNCLGQFVTIQKEVADRLAAQPGTSDYGPLGIIVQAVADVQRIGVVPASCFWPQPQVTSAMVSIRPIEASLPIGDRPAFARFVTELFSKRRKQLGSIFGRNVQLPKGIDPDVRPETLTIPQIKQLSDAIHATGG